MTSNRKEIKLEIIVKSYMTGGHCYLGYDRKHNRIVRPVQLTKATYIDGSRVREPRPIDADLRVGWSYTCTYKQHRQRYLTQLPHKNEDLAIDKIEMDIDTTVHMMELKFADLGTKVERLGQDHESKNENMKRSIQKCLRDLAEHKLITERFVLENEDCSSVKIFRSRPSRLKIYRSSNGKNRISIREKGKVLPTIDLPYTAIETPVLRDRESVIIVMSMCRPYAGTEQNIFDPKRCYALVVGLLQ